MIRAGDLIVVDWWCALTWCKLGHSDWGAPMHNSLAVQCAVRSSMLSETGHHTHLHVHIVVIHHLQTEVYTHGSLSFTMEVFCLLSTKKASPTMGAVGTISLVTSQLRICFIQIKENLNLVQ